MKALHIVASLAVDWGGPPRMVASLCESLQAKGIACTVLAPDLPKGARLVEIEGVRVETFPTGWLSPLWTGHSPKLAARLLDIVAGFDVVHIHELWHHSHYVAAKAASRAGKSYVIAPYGALQPWALKQKPIRKRLYWSIAQRRILERAAAVHVSSKAEAEAALHTNRRSRPVVIPGGVDVSQFAVLPDREVFERSHPELKGKRVILFLGRLHPVKGLDLLADALAELAREDRYSDVYAVCVGPDEDGYLAALERKFMSVGVLERTIFTGALTGEDRLAALSRADLFTLPSYSEGFSVAVLEALAAGLPVLISQACNFPEVSEVEAGEVVAAASGEVASGLRRILDDASHRRRMGENGRKLVQERYTWDQTVNQVIDLYERVAR